MVKMALCIAFCCVSAFISFPLPFTPGLVTALTIALTVTALVLPPQLTFIAVAAYVENAGFGATWSAPIASLLVEKYLTGQISDKRKPLEERMLNGDLMSRVKTY